MYKSNIRMCVCVFLGSDKMLTQLAVCVFLGSDKMLTQLAVYLYNVSNRRWHRRGQVSLFV